MNEFYKLTRGFEEVILEIVSGLASDAILIGLAYVIPQEFRVFYFIVISLINIIAVYKITENFEYAGIFYCLGWFAGLLFLSTSLKLTFLEAIIYGIIPLIIFIYKIYKLEHRYSIY